MTYDDFIKHAEANVECSKPDCNGCRARVRVDALIRELAAGIDLPNHACAPDTPDETAMRHGVVDLAVPFMETAIMLVLMSHAHLDAAGEKLCTNRQNAVAVIFGMTQRAVSDLMNVQAAVSYAVVPRVPEPDPMNPQNLPVPKGIH